MKGEFDGHIDQSPSAVASRRSKTTIIVRVPAVPVAQPRARGAVVGGRARIYTPTKHPITEFKATVRMAFQAVYTDEPLRGPVECHMLFVMPRPASMIWKKRPMPRERHAKKPDRDNLEKAVGDALNGLAWVDDSQICAGRIEKWIAAGDEQPQVLLAITSL